MAKKVKPEVKDRITIVQAYVKLDRILQDFREGEFDSNEAVYRINNLTAECKESGVPFSLKISQSDLDATDIGFPPSYGGSSY